MGKDRAAYVKRDALEIKGAQIKTQHVDGHSGWRQYTYINPTYARDLAFCMEPEEPLACFQAYIEGAEHRARLGRERDLREGATAEHLDRIAPPVRPSSSRYQPPAPPPARG
jgi:hypothetical protein